MTQLPWNHVTSWAFCDLRNHKLNINPYLKLKHLTMKVIVNLRQLYFTGCVCVGAVVQINSRVCSAAAVNSLLTLCYCWQSAVTYINKVKPYMPLNGLRKFYLSFSNLLIHHWMSSDMHDGNSKLSVLCAWETGILEINVSRYCEIIVRFRLLVVEPPFAADPECLVCVFMCVCVGFLW